MVSETIGAYELFVGCFGLRTLKNVKGGRANNGTYVLRIIYRREGNPHGEQVLWLLYHRKAQPINTILEEVRKKLAELDGKTVLVNLNESDYISLPVEVLLLSDGEGFIHFPIPIELKTGEKAYVAAIVGQGRKLNLTEPGMPGLLHAIVANFLSSLVEDPFITAGLRKLEEIRALLSTAGIEMKTIKIGPGGEVKPGE